MIIAQLDNRFVLCMLFVNRVVGCLMDHLNKEHDSLPNIRLPKGIILDAPFTCLTDVIHHRIFMKVNIRFNLSYL